MVAIGDNREDHEHSGKNLRENATTWLRHGSCGLGHSLLLLTAVFASLACLVFIHAKSFDDQRIQLRGSFIESRTVYQGGQQQRRLNIFGEDDRKPVNDSSLYPYSAVGLLRWSEELSCTASLIGDYFIITAAECVLNLDGSIRSSTLEKAEFLPGYEPGNEQAKKAYVTKVHKQSDYWEKWTQNTYVILELDTPLGNTHGILLLPSLSDLDQSAGYTPVQLAGYNDKILDLTQAALQYAVCTCYFPSYFSGPQYMLHHDCDTSANGSPGSPLLVRYTSLKTYIIGIHSNAIGSAGSGVTEETKRYAEYTDATANHGVLGPFIQEQLAFLVQQASSTSTSEASTAASTSSNIMNNGEDDDPEAPAKADVSSSMKDNMGAEKPSQSSDLPVVSQKDAPTQRITPTAAYICIAFVCCAWACVLFIAVRHLRTQSTAV